MNVINFANEVLDMHARICHLEEELEYFRPFEKKYMDSINDGITHSQETFGTIFSALLDKQSPINRGLEIIQKEKQTS